jgi:KipI family sensor histidine kinase inhibitor
MPPLHTITPLGDCALTVDFPSVEGGALRDLLASLTDALRRRELPAITGLVPAIRTLTLHYDPMCIAFDALVREVTATVALLQVVPAQRRAPVVIPVCYGGEYGPDLESVASTHQTTPDAIVAAHTAGEYTVAMIGFLPGFPYLEGLSPALHTPRRSEPRTAVPAGSVGIGGSSTGVYPYSSPGGWHLIGRTPRALFDPTCTPPALLQPGDRVRFVAIPAIQ